MNCYSGTSTRWGQRCVVSISVQNQWDLISLDIGCAFLKGLTFEEVAAMNNTEETVVHFDLPPGGAAILREIEGYESFDSARECLQMLKGGFGLKYAPKLFTDKVSRVFAKYNLKESYAGEEIYLLHENGVLVLICSGHMDDFNAGANVERYVVHRDDAQGVWRCDGGLEHV